MIGAHCLDRRFRPSMARLTYTDCHRANGVYLRSPWVAMLTLCFFSEHFVLISLQALWRLGHVGYDRRSLGPALCSSFRRSAGAEIVRQDASFGHTILATGDNRVNHKLQADSAVQKARPGDYDLGIHARLESVARANDDVLTADHPDLAEAVQRSQFGCGFVAQLQWNRVAARRPLRRGPPLWVLGSSQFILLNHPRGCMAL